MTVTKVMYGYQEEFKMQHFFKDITDLAKTRKFWVAVAGAGVTYLTAKFGTSSELTLLIGVLTALGVYGATNE